MSSHREAPEISKDPVADSTDLYAFVSPDRPNTVTIIANYVPLQSPDGGPNFFEFGDDVLYAINIDNDGDGKADITYQFQFKTTLRNEDTFLYNTGPITSLDSPELEPAAVLLGRPGIARRRRRPSWARTCPARRATSARCSTPNYACAGRRGRAHHADGGATCSPGSGPRASTSTSARSSTCSTRVRWRARTRRSA